MKETFDDVVAVNDELKWLCRKWSDGVFHNDTLLLFAAETRIRFLLELKEELVYGQLHLFGFGDPAFGEFPSEEKERWEYLRTLGAMYLRNKTTAPRPRNILRKIREHLK